MIVTAVLIVLNIAAFLKPDMKKVFRGINLKLNFYRKSSWIMPSYIRALRNM